MHLITKCLTLISIVLTGGFCLYKTVKIYRLRKKYSHLPGPPANGLLGFYLGNLREAIKAINEKKVLSDLMHQWFASHLLLFIKL
jgi:hypothetical protein